MKIEEYINLDSALIMISFVGLLVIMVIYCAFRIASFLIEKQLASVIQEDEEEEKPPYVFRPQAGQIWYKKAHVEDMDYIPWIDVENLESFKVMEIRYNVIKAKNLQTDYFYHFTIADFVMEYMQDDFGDIPKAEKKTEKVEEVKEDEDYMVVEEKQIPSLPAENIIKVDGKDFILTPVKK